MSFLGELKRRNVFKVGAAYAIVAWLLIQVVVTVLPTLEAPQWIVQTIIFVIILGLPVALLLSWAFEMTPEGLVPVSHMPAAASLERSSGRRLNDIILGLLALAVCFLIVDRFLLSGAAMTPATELSSAVEAERIVAPDRASRRVRRSHLILGPSEPLTDLNAAGLNTVVALSPEGERLAYILRQEDVEQLFVRELDTLAAKVLQLQGQGANTPFFTPDGESISYYSAQSIRTIPLSTGQETEAFAEALSGPKNFLHWVDDDHVLGVLTNFSAEYSAVFEYSVSQGQIDYVTAARPNLDQGSPRWLPDGEHLIYTAAPFRNMGSGTLMLFSRTARAPRPIIEGAYAARYAATGHIVFIRDAGLWAVPFDVATLETAGPEVLLIEGVQSNSTIGQAVYDFSNDGTLVYLPGSDIGAGVKSNLVRVDRNGREEELPFEPQQYRDLRISPEGSRIAVAISEGSNSDIWIYDLERETRRKLTFDPTVDRNPRWMPDGDRLIFWSARNGGGYFLKAADGSGDAVELTRATANQTPGEVTSDGRELVYAEVVSGNIDDSFSVMLDGRATTRLLRGTERDEDFPDVSPDGRWLAFESNVAGDGRTEVFVTSFDDPDGGQWQVSNDGGADPRWSTDGCELFYLGPPDRYLTSVVVDTDVTSSFSFGAATVHFPARYSSVKGFWDVGPNGEFFVFPKAVTADDNPMNETSLVLVTNWFEELNRLVPKD